MNQDVLDFVQALVSGSADMAAVHEQHLAQQGELLPHVLMGDITRAVVSAAVRGDVPKWLPILLRQLDAGLRSGRSEVEELIGVSFVENLCGEDEAIKRLRLLMGDALRKEVSVICGI